MASPLHHAPSAPPADPEDSDFEARYFEHKAHFGAGQPAVVVTEATPLFDRDSIATTTTYATRFRPYRDWEDGISTLGNVLWILLGGGIFIAGLYYLFAIVFSVTILGLPCGWQLFKLGNLALLPFGKQLRGTMDDCRCGLHVLGNICFTPLAVVLVVCHLVCAILCACSIVGIPFAVQHFKLANMALCPFGASADAEDYTTVTTTVEHFAMPI